MNNNIGPMFIAIMLFALGFYWIAKGLGIIG